MRLLSRRKRAQFTALQATVAELSARRSAALRIFLASRHAISPRAQHEFWMEFSWHHQEYRMAVAKLARFCLEHQRDVAHDARQSAGDNAIR